MFQGITAFLTAKFRTILDSKLPASPPADGNIADRIAVDPTPTGKDERDSTFSTEDDRRKRQENDSFEQDTRERKRYAENAYGITQTWVGFLIVVTIAQMALKKTGLVLGREEFIAFVTTTTASVFGFWALVGRYLFPNKGDKSDK